MTTLYHMNPYLKEAETSVLSAFEEDDGRFHVVLHDSLFYPQGGGQKGDHGWLTSSDGVYSVVDTIKDRLSSDGRAMSVLAEASVSLVKGQKVTMRLDWPLRYAQMRLHSIVHLHHCMMERAIGKKIPNPSTSDLNHDGTAYNRYEPGIVSDAVAESAIDEMRNIVAGGAPILTRDDDERPGYRYWESLEFSIPCGGTHLRDIHEIGEFSAEISQKKGRVKVDFRLL